MKDFRDVDALLETQSSVVTFVNNETEAYEKVVTNCLSDCFVYFEAEAAAILQTTSVLIGSTVRRRGQKLTDQVGTRQCLNAIQATIFAPLGGGCESSNHAFNIGMIDFFGDAAVQCFADNRRRNCRIPHLFGKRWIIAQREEFTSARAEVDKAIERERILGHPLPESLEVGAMLETPSLALAPRQFIDMADFISIGGNDLKQFFFAADRENERVRRRYDTLNVSYLSFIEQIVQRCDDTGTPVSFCGEDAGRPVEAMCFAAMGLRALSMRPASIGPVKHLLRRVNLDEVKAVMDQAIRSVKEGGYYFQKEALEAEDVYKQHNPNWEAEIVPLDGSERYPAVKSGPYLMQKFQAAGT